MQLKSTKKVCSQSSSTGIANESHLSPSPVQSQSDLCVYRLVLLSLLGCINMSTLMWMVLLAVLTSMLSVAFGARSCSKKGCKETALNFHVVALVLVQLLFLLLELRSGVRCINICQPPFLLCRLLFAFLDPIIMTCQLSPSTPMVSIISIIVLASSSGCDLFRTCLMLFVFKSPMCCLWRSVRCRFHPVVSCMSYCQVPLSLWHIMLQKFTDTTARH